MSSTSNPKPNRPPRNPRALQSFWARVTEGLQMQELWGQFKSEAKESYQLYSKDVDWEAVKQEPSKFKRWWRSVWAMFQAMLMKLTPARRVALLLALFLLIFHPDFRVGRDAVDFNLVSVGALILFVLLALELADRVTMKRDLEIAREIQQWLVPNSPPDVPGTDIAFATRPQNTVAGDYYDAFLRPAQANPVTGPNLLVVVADVAGKSVPAALLMATFQSGLKALSSTPATLEEIVVGLDRYARAHSLEGRRFTTAFLAEVNPATREMRYTNCGHNDPILRRASGTIERLAVGGPPLGLPLFTDNEISYGISTVQLQPGDLLFIFTDGVVEAINEKGEEFAEVRLLASLESASAGNAPQILGRVMTDVNNFVGFARQHDDITALVLRVTT